MRFRSLVHAFFNVADVDEVLRGLIELRVLGVRAAALRASGMKVAAMAVALDCSRWKISQALNFHDRLASDELRRSQRELADPESVPHRPSWRED